MKMKIYIVSQGKYGNRTVNNLANRGLAENIVGIYEVPDDIPEFIDDLEEYVPLNLPEADLIIAVGLYGDINLILPDIAKKTCASSLIIALHDPQQLPPGLEQELKNSLTNEKLVLAKPFCSLTPQDDPLINEFAQQFGKPELEIEADELVRKVKILREAPCGSTRYIAQALEGLPVEEAEFESGNKFHNYPCLASMSTDPQIGDTIMHLAGYQIKEAVNRALGFSTRTAVVDEETCQGGVDCDHLCLDVCPQVKIGTPTITQKDDGRVYIDPASCGCCEICIHECPYGSIEIVEEKIELETRESK